MPDYTPVRLSHLLRYCAPGSIVRGAQDYLLVPMDTRYWCQKRDHEPRPLGNPVERVRRLRAALGIDQELFCPPVSTVDHQGTVQGETLPAVRFPAWAHCSSCGRLYRLPWLRQETDKPCCVNEKCEDHPLLRQVPWALVHEKGYLDDIPWHWLIHRHDDRRMCRDRMRMHYQISDHSLIMWCEACNTKVEHHRHALFATGFFQGVPYLNQQPWTAIDVPRDTLSQSPPVAVEIGDVRIFVPETVDGLVIPPESRIRSDTVAARLRRMPDQLEALRLLEGHRNVFEARLRQLAIQLECDWQEVAQAFQAIQREDHDQAEDLTNTSGQLEELEYQALTTPISDLREDEDFVTRHLSEEWRSLRDSGGVSDWTSKIVGAVQHVVMVQRLREIVIYKGFRRELGQAAELVPPDLTGEQDWLPAMELFGEGLFVAFDERVLATWEQQEAVRKRADVLQRRMVDPNMAAPTPRFMLLHTLAHLMIRSMEAESGYPAASLKERLYVREPVGAHVRSMAGILIYTSVPDKAGTLGGLAEMAQPDRLLQLLGNAFNRAEWCSLDPVCSEHEGTGPQLLNLAACHACALVPDTSCAYENVLLDRIFIRGGGARSEYAALPAFLDFVRREAGGCE